MNKSTWNRNWTVWQVAGAALVAWLLCIPVVLTAQGGFEGPGRYQILNARGGRALEVDRDNPANVRQVDADEHVQTWDITEASRGYFYIRSSVGGNALESVGPRDRPMVRATRFQGSPSQQWRFDTDPDGYVTIVSKLGRPLTASAWGGRDEDRDRRDRDRDFSPRFTLRRVREDRDRRDDRDRRGDRPEARPDVRMETIDAGTLVDVRTNERIALDRSDRRVFTGTVNKDVVDERGRVAIPRGSDVELMVRDSDRNELVLDLESVKVNGRRYAIAADASIAGDKRDGVGANKRTGEMVGGGAVLGTILGAIAGGGKGAAIGAAAGAAAGAGTEVMTRGKAIRVPAESVLTFRLERPLQVAEVRPDERHDRP
jgi:hypothetical protein